MPQKIYSDDLIARAKALRRLGFSFREIAAAIGMPAASVMYHTAAIRVSKDGHSQVIRTLSDIMTAFQPGQVPLPNIIIEGLQKISKQMRERE